MSLHVLHLMANRIDFIRVMEHIEESQEFAPLFIIHSSFSVAKKMISHILPLLPKNNMY